MNHSPHGGVPSRTRKPKGASPAPRPRRRPHEG